MLCVAEFSNQSDWMSDYLLGLFSKLNHWAWMFLLWRSQCFDGDQSSILYYNFHALNQTPYEKETSETFRSMEILPQRDFSTLCQHFKWWCQKNIQTFLLLSHLIILSVSNRLILTNFLGKCDDKCPLVAAFIGSAAWDLFESIKTIEAPMMPLLFNQHLTSNLVKSLKR